MDSDMRARRKRSGWFPYLFAIFATALSMALIVAYTFTTFYDNAKISVRRQAQLSVVDKSEAFAMYMDRARIALDIVSAAAEGIIAEGYDYGRLGDLLHRQSLIINERIESEFTGAYACVNGIYIDGKEWVPPEEYDPTTRDWFKAAVAEKGEVVMVDPYLDAETGKVCISISKLLSDGRSVVSMDIFLDRVQKLTDEVNIGGRSYAIVIDGKGKVLAHTDKNEVGKDYSADSEKKDLLEVMLGKESMVSDSEMGGISRTIFSKRMSTGWYIVLVVDNNDLFANVKSVLHRNIAVAVIATVMVAVICIYVFDRLAKKEAENEELTREREIADRSNKAKSEFLANMSHEIRTPMNAVMGMNEMILRESKDENVRLYAKDIENAGKNLLEIINGILDFSKIESGKMEIVPVDYSLSGMVGDIMNVCSVRAREKSLLLNVTVDPELPSRYHGDEMRMRQIAVNLVMNAIKYTKEGSVTLEVDDAGEHGDGRVSLRLRVRDTGVGIKKEDLPKLFNKFERVALEENRSIEGTGLGLTICHRLAQLMGGNISVESEYGKGSTFIVVVPQEVVDSSPVGDFEKAYMDEKKSKSGAYEGASFTAPTAKILSVDDNEINLLLLEALLKTTEANITSVGSGQEMLDCIAKEHYDLIFLDHMMPGMDGIETLRRAREMEGDPLKGTPVIVLTANAIAGNREKYIGAGFAEYLSKPIDPPKLEEMMIKFLPPEKVKIR